MHRHNPFKLSCREGLGEEMKYVFVCKDGSFRSAIAARLVGNAAAERGISLITDYFGVRDALSNSEKRVILEDAERVYIMEDVMRFDVERVLGYDGEVICLGIQEREDLTVEDISRRLHEEATLLFLYT